MWGELHVISSLFGQSVQILHAFFEFLCPKTMLLISFMQFMCKVLLHCSIVKK